MSRLAEIAQHLITPDQAVSTGWPRVRDTCNNLGWAFDDWQDDLGRLMLSKRADGLYAPSICAMSMPRQVGKTYLVGCIAFAICLTQPGTTVIWTAHRARLATETFRTMRAKAKVPELSAFIDQRVKGGGIRSSNGEQEIEFLNGSRILFGAREAGFGVGFTKVGMLVLDEVQRATTQTMDDMLPATNAAANPLVLCMGTPPRPADDGEVFSMLRREALSGESDDVLYVEIGSGERFDVSNDAEFWRQLRRANPSFPHRVNERAILRNKKGLSEESVLREVFGIWDDDGLLTAIPLPKWRERADRSAYPEPHAGKVWLGVDSTPERSRTSIVAAGMRANGLPMVELTSSADETVDNRVGVDWAKARLIEICSRQDVAAVVIDKRSAAASLVQPLIDAGLPVEATDSAGFAKAWGQFYAAAVETGQLEHLGQPELDAAVKNAGLRMLGESLVPDRKRTSDDISPLIAAQLAHYGLVNGLGVAKNAGRGRVIALD